MITRSSIHFNVGICGCYSASRVQLLFRTLADTLPQRKGLTRSRELTNSSLGIRLPRRSKRAQRDAETGPSYFYKLLFAEF